MSGWTPVRVGLQLVSVGLLTAGIVIGVYSVVTVRWQELDITEFKVLFPLLTLLPPLCDERSLCSGVPRPRSLEGLLGFHG